MTNPANLPAEFLKLRDELIQVVGDRHVRSGDYGDRDSAMTVFPASTAEVAAVVAICHRLGFSIVPEGGRTGLVGGTCATPADIVLSLSRMSRIESIYPAERAAVVEAGVPLEALQTAALVHRLEPGIDLAARGSATIGGMISTNAGGIMAFRYGVMRHRILGLEAVLPDGSIYSDLTRVVKNTAGYDLKQLFIGAEGTLGIVTRAVVKLEPVPDATATILLGLPSVAAALDAISLALKAEAGHLRAAEGMWQRYIRLTAGAQGWSEPSVPLDAPVYLLLTLGGARDDLLAEDVENLFARVLERHASATGIAASSSQQEAVLWRLREDTDQLYRAHSLAPSYDISVPLSEMEAYVARIMEGLAGIDHGISPYVFGHLADGNLHIVLDRVGPLPDVVAAQVEAVLYESLRSLGGSFSAEHGIGSKRVNALMTSIDSGKLAMMKQVKGALDSQRLMNPGKVLPDYPPARKKDRVWNTQA